MNPVGHKYRNRAGWLVPAAFVLSASFPLFAEAASGAELVAIFRTHCVEPFPSVEEIAAAARHAGLEEHPLTVESVLGSNVMTPVPDADPASVVGFDARAFWPPTASLGASLIAAPTITAVFIERSAADIGHVTETACSVSATKASEGRAGLPERAEGVAQSLEDRFGYPFEWIGQATHETSELVAGEITWRPAGRPQQREDRPDISASLQYIEIEPRDGHRESSFWLLAVELREPRS